MDLENFYTVLSQYIPEKSLDYVVQLIQKHPLHVIITKKRKTKHGDFSVRHQKQPQITINHNLNSYAFLITFLHEMAHYIVFKNYKKKTAPHGKEWKDTFRNLMLPILNNDVFPDDVISVLAQHLRNPKASSHSDPQLVSVLRKYDEPTELVLLQTLKLGTIFQLDQKNFKLGTKRRTRFICEEIHSKKTYLVNINAEVLPINPTNIK